MKKTDDEKLREVISKLDGCREEIEKIAARQNLNYEQIMEAADQWLETGESTCLSWDLDYENYEEFWKLYEIVRGRKDPNTQFFFRCAC